MNKQSEKDAMVPDHYSFHSHAPLNNLKLGKTAWLLVPIGLLVMVILHLGGVILLSVTGSSIFTLNNPISYVIFGLLVLVGILKINHLSAYARRKSVHTMEESTSGEDNAPHG
jgi:hypothetical protein